MTDACQAAFESLESFQKMFPEFSARSRSFGDDVPLFRNRELGNYQLSQTFPGSGAASALPGEIAKALGISKNLRFVGAYPPLP